jgi:phosphoribosylformylglycinamidine synthase I
MEIAVIQFPGSNCARETCLALKRVGMDPLLFLWNEPNDRLNHCDGFVIVGGFSYEDRSRAGIIAARDPVMDVLKTQSNLGKPILGICNGAQILLESGLVPGLPRDAVAMALTNNKRMHQGRVIGTGYYNAWVYLTLTQQKKMNAFTRHLTKDSPLRIPVAHGEGRFVMSLDLLEVINEQGLGVLKYCDEKGVVVDEFPVNPNGSVDNLAAIVNKAGNVMAMMPHPERTIAGDVFFHSMRDYILSSERFAQAVLDYQPKPIKCSVYSKPAATYEMVVKLMIADNHALSVENALKRQGISVCVKRLIHWEIACDSRSIFHQIQISGLLYNERKERIINPLDNKKKVASFLVRCQDDVHGLNKMQQLKHVGLEGAVTSIQHGILWQIEACSEDLAALAERVILSGLLFNPAAHRCYNYA